jgi:hypothetical protein
MPTTNSTIVLLYKGKENWKTAKRYELGMKEAYPTSTFFSKVVFNAVTDEEKLMLASFVKNIVYVWKTKDLFNFNLDPHLVECTNDVRSILFDFEKSSRLIIIQDIEVTVEELSD